MHVLLLFEKTFFSLLIFVSISTTSLIFFFLSFAFCLLIHFFLLAFFPLSGESFFYIVIRKAIVHPFWKAFDCSFDSFAFFLCRSLLPSSTYTNYTIEWHGTFDFLHMMWWASVCLCVCRYTIYIYHTEHIYSDVSVRALYIYVCL